MSFVVNNTTVITSDRIVRLNSGATGSRPGSPSTGMMFFNTTTAKLEVWNGSAWKEASTTGTGEIASAWGWGVNQGGRLGDGTNVASRLSPVSVVGGFTDWVQICPGNFSGFGIRANGTAWSWGRNFEGQLGNGTTTSTSSPISIIGGFTDWKQIRGGSFSAFGIRANGTLWAWGYNNFGRLGDGTTTNRSSPVSVVGGFTDWKQVSDGGEATGAIRSNGTAWCWGRNTVGQLGDGTTTDRSSPVSVVGGFTDWTQISGNGSNIVAIRASGTAWAWGSNGNGQLGDGTTSSRSSPVSVVGGFTDWVQVSCGSGHTLAVRSNGTAWAWGRNTSGRLGDGTTTSTSSPVSVVGGFTDWVQVAAQNDSSQGLRTNGTIWGWGSNGGGNLGDGTTTSRTSPVSVVGGFTDWVTVASHPLASFSLALRTQPKKNN